MSMISTCFFLLILIYAEVLARTATVVLYQNGTNNTYGRLTLSQSDSSSSVIITGLIQQLNISTAHGFHVHTNAVSEIYPTCGGAGGHFNPYNVSHGSPPGNLTSRHVGDLGNITANSNGSVYVNITDSIIDLYNATRLIVNRTLIIHALYDDGGLTTNNESTITGAAGARLACGLIKLVSNSARSLSTKNIHLILSFIILIFFF